MPVSCERLGSSGSASRVRMLGRRAAAGERQRRARQRKRLAARPKPGARPQAAAAAAESHAVERRQESTGQQAQVGRLDPDGGKTITLPNGRRIGYWPHDGPHELARARRLVSDAGYNPDEYGL
jgi:murein DD-endopeptidase MepM/ murein hydrolase activator NlpD